MLKTVSLVSITYGLADDETIIDAVGSLREWGTTTWSDAHRIIRDEIIPKLRANMPATPYEVSDDAVFENLYNGILVTVDATGTPIWWDTITFWTYHGGSSPYWMDIDAAKTCRRVELRTMVRDRINRARKVG